MVFIRVGRLTHYLNFHNMNVKAPISRLLQDDATLMAILPSALNGWIEEAVSEYGIPQLLEMVGLGAGGRSADVDEERDEKRRRERMRAEGRRAGLCDDLVSVSEEHGIAIVDIEGTLSPYYWDSVDPRGIGATLRGLRDRGVRTIVSNIDSPGGHATYIRELGDIVREVSDGGVRMVAYAGAGSMMCSAAYWYGAAHDVVYGSTASLPGSIGVFSALYEFSGLMGKMGIALKLFRDGPLKGLGIFGKELTAEESAHIQAGVDKVSGEFKGFVRARRPGIGEDSMMGQAVDGDEAVARGLYDGEFSELSELVAALIE